MCWAGIKQILAMFQATEARNGPSWARRAVIAIIEDCQQLAACELLIKMVDGKFTPRPKINIMGLSK